MKKYLLFLSLLAATNLSYAQTKITELTELATPDGSDLLVIVDDPAGTPITKKITATNLMSLVPASDLVNDTSPQLGGDLDLNSFQITGSGGTISGASSPVLDLSQTWDDVAVTMTGIKLNVGDTNSAADSLLMDLQVGGASKLVVGKGGDLEISSGTVTDSSPALTVTQTWNDAVDEFRGIAINVTETAAALNSDFLRATNTSNNFYFAIQHDGAISGNNLNIHPAGYAEANVRMRIQYDQLKFANYYPVTWVSTADAYTGVPDVYLYRDNAAGTLALRNGANAQAFHTYNTWTDASNNELIALRANSNVFELASIANGTGTLRGIRLGVAGNSLGFLGATPVAQQSGTGETTGFTAGAGTAVNDDSTFTGNVGATAYRVNDIVKALKNYGLLAQ